MKKPMKPKALSMAAYYALVSISIVCTVCVGAFLVAVLGMKLFYHGPVTGTVALILGIVICTLTMIVSGLLLAKEARHMAKPVSKVSTATWKIAGGDFTTRVEPEDTKVPVLELMVLEENFNRMAEELGAMDVLRKDFISNVSHEFKTPIASIAAGPGPPGGGPAGVSETHPQGVSAALQPEREHPEPVPPGQHGNCGEERADCRGRTDPQGGHPAPGKMGRFTHPV